MPQGFDEGQVHAWLSMLYADTEGFVNICSTGNWTGRNFRDIDAATAYVAHLDKSAPQGIYARVTTLREEPKQYSRGDVDLTHEFIGFWADLDITHPSHKWHLCPADGCPDAGNPKHKENFVPLLPDTETCLLLIKESGLPEPTEWIHSGGGMYPWWLLREPIYPATLEDLPPFIEMAANWQRVIKLTADKMGYHYGSGVGDLVRVLRIPGTVNRKDPEDVRPCEWRTDLGSAKLYDLSELTHAMDTALLQLEPPKVAPQLAAAPPKPQSQYEGGTAPGDAFNAGTTWYQLLLADGATIFKDRGIGYVEWTRPGKDKRDGMSATTGHMGSDVLKIFTDAWTGLDQGKTYSRFGYYAATRFNGDHRAAARHLAAEGWGERGQRKATNPGPSDPHGKIFTDWDVAEAGFTEADKPTEADIKKGIEAQIAKRPESRTFTYTDSGFADRMAARDRGEWHCVNGKKDKTWLYWDDAIWREDKRTRVPAIMERLIQDEHLKLKIDEDEKGIAALRPMLSNNHIMGAVSVFARREGIAAAADDFDRDEHRLKVTVDNGYYDLAAMEFRQPDRTLMQTKKMNVTYNPDATAPGWEKFLTEVLPDPAVREYVQRAAGYTLTGDTDRKAIFMLHGESNTGKSQFLNVLKSLFGSMSETANAAAFAAKENNDGPSPGLHKLQAARLVAASETNEGMRLDEALIKRLTGGEDVTSRGLYQSEVTWRPRFTMWMATNHLPKLSSDDNAIWKRVKPIHFSVVFGNNGGPEEVFDIGQKLIDTEASGILNWILDGVRKYREHGLTEPQALRDGVAAYQADSDPVAKFITQMIEEEVVAVEEHGHIDSKQIYNFYQHWCAEEGIRYPLPANRFGRRMTTLGYTNGRDKAGVKRIWYGLALGTNTFIVSGTRLQT